MDLSLSTLIPTVMKCATDSEERAERVPAKSAKSFAILSTHPNTLLSVTLLLIAMATTAVLTHASAERDPRVPDVVTTAVREEKDTDTMVTATATDTLVPTIHKYSSFPFIAKAWHDKIVPKRMFV